MGQTEIMHGPKCPCPKCSFERTQPAQVQWPPAHRILHAIALPPSSSALQHDEFKNYADLTPAFANKLKYKKNMPKQKPKKDTQAKAKAKAKPKPQPKQKAKAKQKSKKRPVPSSDSASSGSDSSSDSSSEVIGRIATILKKSKAEASSSSQGAGA